MPRNWTAEEHAKLLVAIIKTGKPTLDTTQIAAYLNNGRTKCAVYFEIRRLKRLAEGGLPAADKKRPRDSPRLSPHDLAPVKAEPRPVRATRPSAAKRRYDEVVNSGFWDEDDADDGSGSTSSVETPAKKRARRGKAVKPEEGVDLDGKASRATASASASDWDSGEADVATEEA